MGTSPATQACSPMPPATGSATKCRRHSHSTTGTRTCHNSRVSIRLLSPRWWTTLCLRRVLSRTTPKVMPSTRCRPSRAAICLSTSSVTGALSAMRTGNAGPPREEELRSNTTTGIRAQSLLPQRSTTATLRRATTSRGQAWPCLHQWEGPIATRLPSQRQTTTTRSSSTIRTRRKKTTSPSTATSPPSWLGHSATPRKASTTLQIKKASTTMASRFSTTMSLSPTCSPRTMRP